jgi:hypothetical protein
MIFWLLLFGGLIASYGLAIYATDILLLRFGIWFIAYIVFGAAAILFSMGLSLWLGKTDKYVLREKRRYYITEDKDNIITVHGYETNQKFKTSRDFMDEIHKDPVELCPYVEIEIYNTGGWRRWLLLDAYPNEYRYVLYEPTKEEES